MSQPSKRCRKCGLIKPIDLFPRDRHSSDGYRARCNPCHAADVRQWTHAEPERLERVRRRVAEWKEQHPERHPANEHERHKERWRDDPLFRQAFREKWRRYRQKNAQDERDEILRAFGEAGDVVVLSGDVHIGLAMDLPRDRHDERPVAIEFVTSSLTSQNVDDKYMIVDVTPERVRGEWWFVDAVREPTVAQHLGAVWEVPRGEPGLVPGA